MKDELLLNVKCFLLDRDGTFNLGDQLIDGSLLFIETLDKLGIDYLFLTNNSSKHRRQYAEKISRLGLPISEEKVFTSGEATALYLQREYPDSPIYLVGAPALEKEFRQHGLELDEDSPRCVVLGFDTTLTYENSGSFVISYVPDSPTSPHTRT